MQHLPPALPVPFHCHSARPRRRSPVSNNCPCSVSAASFVPFFSRYTMSRSHFNYIFVTAVEIRFYYRDHWSTMIAEASHKLLPWSPSSRPAPSIMLLCLYERLAKS